MGRMAKDGLSFFYLDIVLEENVKYLEARHGLLGFGVLVKLWGQIYHKNGYWCEWTEKSEYLFAKENAVEISFLRDVIISCFDGEIFDKKMYEKYKILTSSGVQKFWKQVVHDAKRKNTQIDPKISLLNSNSGDNEINSGGNKIKSGYTQEDMPQRKEKEIKEEKTSKELDPNQLDRMIIAAAASGNGQYKKLVNQAIQAAAAKNNFFEFDENSETLRAGDKMLIKGFHPEKSSGIVSPTLYITDWVEKLKTKNEKENNQRSIVHNDGAKKVVFK